MDPKTKMPSRSQLGKEGGRAQAKAAFGSHPPFGEGVSSDIAEGLMSMKKQVF
jgi:hypothetical protein